MYTVGELSRLTGVTVRALHHYDDIGLVRPSQRSAAGYRLYEDADVLRLQQVLLFRELGFPLEAIAAAIDAADPVTLEPLPHGQTGMLRFVDLANVDSVVAVQTMDLGRVTDAGVELFGRAPSAMLRGCSLAVEDLLVAGGL